MSGKPTMTRPESPGGSSWSDTGPTEAKKAAATTAADQNNSYSPPVSHHYYFAIVPGLRP